jgi:hypothetical protein
MDTSTEYSIVPYVFPTWVDNDFSKDQFPLKSGTKILLGLKDGVSEEVKQAVATLSPSSILFLQKLTRMTIKQNNGSSFASEFVRVCNSDSTMDIKVKSSAYEKTFSYWMQRKCLTVDNRTTTVTVAFPLSDSNDAGTVFVYLPLTITSGLPVIMNAEFTVVANREDIKDIKSTWNVSLISGLASCYVNGIIELAHSSQKDRSQRALAYVPLSSSLFPNVAEKVQLELQEKECVLSTENKLLKPGAIKRTHIDELYRLFELHPQTEYAIVHMDVNKAYQEQLKVLKVPLLTDDEICNLLTGPWFSGLLQTHHSIFLVYEIFKKYFPRRIGNSKVFIDSDGKTQDASTVYRMVDANQQLFDQLNEKLLLLGMPTVKKLNQDLHDKINGSESLRDWLWNSIPEFSIDRACTKMVSKMNNDTVVNTTRLLFELDRSRISVRRIIDAAEFTVLTQKNSLRQLRWYQSRGGVVMPPALGKYTTMFNSEAIPLGTVLSNNYCYQCTPQEKVLWCEFLQKMLRCADYTDVHTDCIEPCKGYQITKPMFEDILTWIEARKPNPCEELENSLRSRLWYFDDLDTPYIPSDILLVRESDPCYEEYKRLVPIIATCVYLVQGNYFIITHF